MTRPGVVGPSLLLALISVSLSSSSVSSLFFPLWSYLVHIFIYVLHVHYQLSLLTLMLQKGKDFISRIHPWA